MAAANDEAPAPAEGAAAPAAPTAAPRAQTSAQTTLHKEFSENAAKLRAPFTEQGTFQLVVGARARARALSFTIRRGSYTNTRAQSEGQADGHQGRKKYIARTHTHSVYLSLSLCCVCVCVCVFLKLFSRQGHRTRAFCRACLRWLILSFFVKETSKWCGVVWCGGGAALLRVCTNNAVLTVFKRHFTSPHDTWNRCGGKDCNSGIHQGGN